mmetsp:Transcript_82681/g.246576  ORF Transcript_82681/g.246576 Transcript_82681/m.246576 type:complete len:308 (-) Transcript_82681:105-1028(-)
MGLKAWSSLEGQLPWLDAMSWKVDQEKCCFRFQWHIWFIPTQHQFRSLGYLSFTFFISQTRFQASGRSQVRIAASGIGAEVLQNSLLRSKAGSSPAWRAASSSVGGITFERTLSRRRVPGEPGGDASPRRSSLLGDVMTVSWTASRTWSCRYVATPLLRCGDVASTMTRAATRMATPQRHARVYNLLFVGPLESRCELLRAIRACSMSSGMSGVRSGSSGLSQILTYSLASPACILRADLCISELSVKLCPSSDRDGDDLGDLISLEVLRSWKMGVSRALPGDPNRGPHRLLRSLMPMAATATKPTS